MDEAKMAAVAAAEAWAADHVSSLQKLLDDPTHDHGVRSELPHDGLRAAHVIGLVGQLSTSNRIGKPWKQYAGRLKGGQQAALHTWLYHLGGGAESKLVQPTGVYNDSFKLMRPIASHLTRPLVPSPLVTAPAALQSSPLTLTQVLGRREAGPTVRSSIPPALIPLPPRSYPLRPALLTPHLPPH